MFPLCCGVTTWVEDHGGQSRAQGNISRRAGEVTHSVTHSSTGPGYGGEGRVSSCYLVCKVLLCVS